MAKSGEKCRLVRLEIEDFMRCKVVRIPFGDEPLLPVRGWNAEGKSSVLRAFMALVGGEKAVPDDPIRHGAESAQVLGELDNGYVVRRRFTASGNSYLTIETKDGASFKSPQKVLDELVGRISFDPLAFKALDSKKQREALQKIAGVDVGPAEAKRKTAYEARTIANRQVDSLKARLTAIPEVDAPDQEMGAADLLAEQEKLAAVKRANDAKRAELRRFHDADYKRAVTALEGSQREVEDLERRLAAARANLDVAQKAKDAAVEKGKALKAEVEALRDPDTADLSARIAHIDDTNRRVRAKRDRAALATELDRAREEAGHLDREVAAAEAEKSNLLAQAKFPVPGLGFADEGITYEGVPFAQASQAQQIRVSMAMGLALNPRLPVVCIRDGSLLDPRSLEIVRQMAADAGAQVLLEIVSHGGSGITIEDGTVVEIDGRPVAVPAPAEVA